MQHKKIHILYSIKDGAWGGANQFLRALRDALRNMGRYAETIAEADIVLFNSFPFGELQRVWELRDAKKAGKTIIHRVDGPISLYRGKDLAIDTMIYTLNRLFADGTIFQSTWSKENNHTLGMPAQDHEAVIINAPDESLFYRKEDVRNDDQKLKLIATSWSSNMKKGFPIYAYLDAHLDFSQYEMTFVGNSPIPFTHIQHIQPQESATLAQTLRSHDIYITASQNDACSNSLIEALHSGLPVVVRNSGGHPEIAGSAGMVFENEQDVCTAIDTVAADIRAYQEKIVAKRMHAVVQEYIDFCERAQHTKAHPLLSLQAAAFFVKAKLFRV